MIKYVKYYKQKNELEQNTFDECYEFALVIPFVVMRVYFNVLLNKISFK